MAALWMARCGVKTRIIDARATKVFRGHADGMQSGTLDIFESFGIVEDLYKNAAPAVEMTFWVCESWLLSSTYSDSAHIGRHQGCPPETPRSLSEMVSRARPLPPGSH